MKMDLGSLIFGIIVIVAVCYIIYDSIPSEYAKLVEIFGGYADTSSVKLENEKSPLHSIFCGASGSGKTFL